MRGKNRKLCIILTILGLAAIVFLYFNNPSISKYYPPCPFYYTTGLYCPGCGTLRAGYSIIHGHFIRALSFNPLSTLIFPVIVWFVTVKLAKCMFKKDLWLPQLPSWTSKALLVLIILFWILRNLPWYPFNLLAPH